MDQDHGNGMGEWDPNSFAGGHWDHQFADPGLSFDAHHPQDHAYPSPDHFMNPQISAPESQPGLYRPYGYFNPGDVWPGSGQTESPYSQEQLLPQGYYQDPEQPSNDGRQQTADSRFAVVDMPQTHEYPAHLQTSNGQNGGAHGFNGNSIQAANPVPSGYLQGSVPQWQQYENSLASSQPSNIRASGHTGSPLPYPQNHGSTANGMQNYHPDLRQPINSQQTQAQFVPVSNGQQLQGHASAAQLAPPGRTSSPLVISQPVAQRVVQSTSQQPVINPLAAQTPHGQVIQARVPQVYPLSTQSQLQVVQQSAPAVTANVGSGVKRRPTQETAEPKIAAKKAKVVVAPAQASLVSALQSQPASSAQPSQPASLALAAPSGPSTKPADGTGTLTENVLTVDDEVLRDARGRTDGTWPGVPNLAIGALPEKLKKGPPTKRYVTIATKGGRDPLFPDLPRGWAPAEVLGNHYEAYQEGKTELDRQRADMRLDVELKRIPSEMPAGWWEKLPKRDGVVAKRAPSPLEPLKTGIKAAELVRTHPAHKRNKLLRAHTLEDYRKLLDGLAQTLRDSPDWAPLRSKNKASGTDNSPNLNTHRRRLQPLMDQLEAAITQGLEFGQPAIFRTLGEQPGRAARFVNILVRLCNIGEGASALAKAILRLFGRFTAMLPSQLKNYKFSGIQSRLETTGDAEVKELVMRILENAEKNRDKDQEPKKEGEKEGEKKRVPSGVKRTREEDESSDSRTGKKKATNAPAPSLPAGVKATPAGAKLAPAAARPAPSSTSAKPPAKSSTATASGPTAPPSAAPAKRPSLLLPGKIRLPSKTAPKQDAPKAEGFKAPVKTEPASTSTPTSVSTPASASKPQPAKAEPPKPAQVMPRTSEPPQPSKIGALVAQIETETKTIRAPEPPPIAAPELKETDQEKARRLRKEARRKLNLKVTFKSDDRLVEIREFTQHPEEIRQNTAFRDLRSENRDKMEGIALKKGKKEKESELREWEEPTPISFDSIPQHKREETYVTRGGLRTFHTDQQKFMEDREIKELMVIYTDPADIPLTPKSPHYEPELLVGESSARTIALPKVIDINSDADVRLKEALDEIYARDNDVALVPFPLRIKLALDRLQLRLRPDFTEVRNVLKKVDTIATSYHGAIAAPNPKPKPESRSETDTPSADQRDQQTYQLLTSDRVKNYKDLEPYDPANPKTTRSRDYGDPLVQRDSDAVEDLVASMRGVHPQPAQMPIVNPEPVAPAVAPQPAEAAPDYAAWAQYYAHIGQHQQAALYAQHAQAQAHAQQQNAYMQQQNAYVQQQNAYVQQQQQPQQAYTQPTNPYQHLQVPQVQPNNDAASQLQAILGNLGATQPQQPAADPQQLQALMAAFASTQPQAQQPVPATTATPQHALYLLDLMKQGQAGAAAKAVVDTAAQEQAQGDARQYHSHGSYPQGSFGLSRQERDGYDGRDRERERERDRDRDHRGRGNGSNGWGNKSDLPDHLRGINRSLIGTKQCTFYARGQCAKGDKCTFRHD